MDLHLKGKNALVTGGSKGIGQAIAEGFAVEGADVAICARSAPDVTAAVAALAGCGVKAWGAALDVAAGAAAALGGIDILVCNVSALAVGDTPESWTPRSAST